MRYRDPRPVRLDDGIPLLDPRMVFLILKMHPLHRIDTEVWPGLFHGIDAHEGTCRASVEGLKKAKRPARDSQTQALPEKNSV